MTAYCTLYRKASLLRGVESLGGVWRPTKGGPLGLLRRAGRRKVGTTSQTGGPGGKSGATDRCSCYPWPPGSMRSGTADTSDRRGIRYLPDRPRGPATRPGVPQSG